MYHITSPVVPEYMDSLGQLPQGVRTKHITSPVVPEYSDSLGQLPQGMRTKHITSGCTWAVAMRHGNITHYFACSP